jgi:hypothetical protein
MQVEVRPIDVARPIVIGDSRAYEVCGLRPGVYQLAFSRDTSELLVDVHLEPGRRYTVNVCETTLAVARWPLTDPDSSLEPPRQIERCP